MQCACTDCCGAHEAKQIVAESMPPNKNGHRLSTVTTTKDAIGYPSVLEELWWSRGGKESRLSALLCLLGCVLCLEVNWIVHGANACQIDNRQMHACLHTYLERDFSLVEELLRRPPFSEDGHILLEESELENMCSRMEELKQCYERMIDSCVAYDAYMHMRRVIKTVRALHHELCGQSFQIRNLIEGGYCIEYSRKNSACSSQHDSGTESTVVSDLKPRQQWPFTLTSMLRFEIGHKACSYLTQFTQCLSPYVEMHCRTSSSEVWNSSMTNIMNIWCNNDSLHLSSVLSLLFVFFNIALSVLMVDLYS